MRNIARVDPKPVPPSDRTEPTSDRLPPSDRVQATAIQACHAALAGSGDSVTVIGAVLKRAGVTVLRSAPPDSVFHPGQTLALAMIRTLFGRRGPERAYDVLAALARAGLAPITSDHIRVAEVFLCEEEYWGAFEPASVTQAFRSMTPGILAEARELAAAKHMAIWRALEETMYRRFALGCVRSRPPKTPKAPISNRTLDLDRTAPPARPPSPKRIGVPTKRPVGARTFDVLGHVVIPSPELAAVVGVGPLLRTDAIAALSRYIDSRGLNDPADRGTVVADAKLRAVFGKDRIPVSELGQRMFSREAQVA